MKRGASAERGSYKVGKPYNVAGVWYHPKEDLSYVETGKASWYGPTFHGRRTANGERFDKNALTAAHPTLQLPSVVRVTNLRNGRVAVVRVNDRGPFADGRIIDLSERAAEVLGFKKQGTTKVKLELLEAESRHVAQLARSGASAEAMNAYMLGRFGPDGSPRREVQVAGAAPTGSGSISATATDGIFVQAGAFSSRANAYQLQADLSQYGRTLIDTVDRSGNTLYRVRIGPFGSVSTAGTMLARLVDDGHAAARIAVE